MEIVKKEEELTKKEKQARHSKERSDRLGLPPSFDLEEDIGRIGQQHGLDVSPTSRPRNWADWSSSASSVGSIETSNLEAPSRYILEAQRSQSLKRPGVS